jgi:hypothetical protein
VSKSAPALPARASTTAPSPGERALPASLFTTPSTDVSIPRSTRYFVCTPAYGVFVATAKLSMPIVGPGASRPYSIASNYGAGPATPSLFFVGRITPSASSVPSSGRLTPAMSTGPITPSIGDSPPGRLPASMKTPVAARKPSAAGPGSARAAMYTGLATRLGPTSPPRHGLSSLQRTALSNSLGMTSPLATPKPSLRTANPFPAKPRMLFTPRSGIPPPGSPSRTALADVCAKVGEPVSLAFPPAGGPARVFSLAPLPSARLMIRGAG